jgi:hypothetical protein
VVFDLSGNKIGQVAQRLWGIEDLLKFSNQSSGGSKCSQE